MLWLFERDEQVLRVETRFDNATMEYVVTTRSGAGEKTERFHDSEVFHARLIELEQALESDRWSLAGPPALLRDGWPRPPVV